MEKINFKHPKYIIPLLALPFLCLFFYVYQSGAGTSKPEQEQKTGLNPTMGNVSPDVQKKNLSDKLDTYRDTYKEADGFTAVSPLEPDTGSKAGYANAYSDRQKQTLDSIDNALRNRYAGTIAASKPVQGVSAKDKAIAEAIAGLTQRRKPDHASRDDPGSAKEPDPMDMFKMQMAYMDSIGKANDPEAKAEKQKQDALAKVEALKLKQVTLPVKKAEDHSADFNTVYPNNKEAYIMAAIDENLTGYAGSRIRLRLLEDIKAGNTLVRKGTVLYAIINGFGSQRVTFEITTILYDNKILPVKLDIYDLDGLPGLYVPESAFRDFTKNLGGNSIQGVNISGSSETGNQLLMSSVDKLFQSTSTAIAEAIRKNKAKIKYNSYIYLIDNEALQSAQKNY